MLDIDFNEIMKKMALERERIEGSTPGGNETVREISYDVVNNPSTGELSRGDKLAETYQIIKKDGEVLRFSSNYKKGVETLDCLPYRDAPDSDITRSFERKIGGSKLWECTLFKNDAVAFNKYFSELSLRGEGVFDIAKLPHPVRPAVAKAAVTKFPFLKGCAEIMKYASKIRI